MQTDAVLATPGHRMKIARRFSSRLDADLARIALDAAGVPSVVVGTSVEFEGGTNGVQLLVPDEWFAAAARVLEEPGSTDRRKT